MSCQGKKYITLNDGGIDFRKIARIMTNRGYPLNHATARNQVIHAMKELLLFVSEELGADLTPEQAMALVNNKDTHDALHDVLYLAYKRDREFFDREDESLTQSVTEKDGNNERKKQ